MGPIHFRGWTWVRQPAQLLLPAPRAIAHSPIATAIPAGQLRRNTSGVLDSARRAGWVVLAPNAVIFAAAAAIGVPHAWINLDYVLIAVLRPSRRLFISLLAAAVASDLFITTSALFGLTPADAELCFLPRAALATAAVVTVVGLGALVTRLARERYRGDPTALKRAAAVLVALFLVDVANGSSGLALSALKIRGNITTSAAAQTLRAAFVASASLSPSRGAPVPSAVQLALLPLLDHATTEKPDVLLVIDESLGLFRDSAADSMLARSWDGAFAAITHATQAGVVPSHGATTNAELRELCGVDGNYRSALMGMLKCVPNALAAQGYLTESVHGFRSFGFHRDAWYPRIGLHRSMFLPELDRAGLTTRCGALLRGACDGAIGQYVAKMFEGPPLAAPRFVYWLTLNTHLPLDPDVEATPASHCDGISALSSETLCLYARQHERLLAVVASSLAQPHCRELVVLVVGDHPPPFPSPSNRNAFREGQVPYFRTIIPASADSAVCRPAS